MPDQRSSGTVGLTSLACLLTPGIFWHIISPTFLTGNVLIENEVGGYVNALDDGNITVSPASIDDSVPPGLLLAFSGTLTSKNRLRSSQSFESRSLALPSSPPLAGVSALSELCLSIQVPDSRRKQW